MSRPFKLLLTSNRSFQLYLRLPSLTGVRSRLNSLNNTRDPASKFITLEYASRLDLSSTCIKEWPHACYLCDLCHPVPSRTVPSPAVRFPSPPSSPAPLRIPIHVGVFSLPVLPCSCSLHSTTSCSSAAIFGRKKQRNK